MSVNAHPDDAMPFDWAALRRWLAEELRPRPGRVATVLRMLASSTLLMLLVMNLQLQYAFLGVFNALIISRESPRSLLRTGPLVLLANVAALVYVLFGLSLFSSYPIAYVVFLLASFILVFYVKAVIANDNVAFGFGVPITVTTTFLWYMPMPLGERVDAMLSLISAVILSTLIAMAIAWLVLWIHGGHDPMADAALRNPVPPGPNQRPAPPYRPWTGLLAPDAWTNRDYLRSGLRGCVAGSLCLTFDSAIAWPMIMGACAMACTVTGTPASILGSPGRRFVTRSAGLMFGGVILGMGAQTLLLPWIGSIAGFTLQFVLFSAVAAWLATCSPRLSYAGTVTAMAYLFTMFERFGPSTSLARSRDVMVDIFLGIVVIWLVVERPRRTAVQSIAMEQPAGPA